MIPKNLLVFLVGMALFFTWSCDSETVSKGKSGTEESTITIKQEDTGAAYTFSVGIFMWESYAVFQGDKVNTATQGIWDKVFLRWGFRKKPTPGAAEMPIYWVQKATNDKDISSSYTIEVDKTQKYAFTPQEKDFPSALQAELEGNLEIYLQLQVATATISAQLAMPADFKTKLGILGISPTLPTGGLATPTSLTVRVGSHDPTSTLDVTWDAVPDAGGYIVICNVPLKSDSSKIDNSVRGALTYVGVERNAYTIFGMTPGTRYGVQVFAYDKGGKEKSDMPSAVFASTSSVP